MGVAVLAVIAVVAILLPVTGVFDGSSSSAMTVVSRHSTSANWAGYVDAGARFSTVSGSWVVPSVKRSVAGYSAFWVGLGGASSTSPALEQVGTESDSVNGRESYVAWYELVPAASVHLPLTVRPGDRIDAKVQVSGTTVVVSLKNRTTGKSIAKTLHMTNPSPDTASAEWIAEAPSTAIGGNAAILPLARFGSVRFDDASATAGGHTGSITDSHWTPERIDLGAPTRAFRGPGPGFAGPPPPPSMPLDQASANAFPSPLTNHGAAFTVTRHAVATSRAPGDGLSPAG